MENHLSNSELNRLIPAEIKNDEFYIAIQKLIQAENIKTILEVGSSSGEGSTEALVRAIQRNPHQPTLFCIEVSQARFSELQKRYLKYPFVKCYNVSSVSLDKFPTEKKISQFYTNNRTYLNYYPLERVLGWLHQDIDYIKASGILENGIKIIKNENNIENFDVVLIDGSEFTGQSELNEVYGAKFVLLDDINTFKNHHNHHRLLADTNYTLIAHNPHLRNGYSIFKRVDAENKFYFTTERREQLLVKNLIQEGAIVFDVGANIGDYSILFSQLVGQQGKVYAFEPTSSTFERLKQRIKDIPNISAYPKAIYSENKIIQLNEFPENYSVWNSIGKPKMPDPLGMQDFLPILKQENVEAITLDAFCQEQHIEKIDYLKIDVEGAESEVLQGCSKLLKKKAIHFIQFEVSQKMLEGLNKTAQESFDILVQNGYECHQISSQGEIGEAATKSESFYENYIAFPALPIHFFTIVLNGEPFIRYHIDIFKQLPFKWHWHIIEGVADLKHDTAWSLPLGGKITADIHNNGLSKDGTTEYLDELAKLYPENITLYRKTAGIFWDGKREMVNAPLANIQEECLLWQVDVDELWTVEQLCKGRQLFINNPDKTAAFYWCWFFVGENLIISTRNCYAQVPEKHWLRTWRYKPGYIWVLHEPPTLAAPLPDNQWQNIAKINPFLHQETESQGLIFQHFAYATQEQLQFKEQYYGYQNAVIQWKALQANINFPVFLREYFFWVRDNTMVDTAQSCGVVPIAQKQESRTSWRFLKPEEVQAKIAKLEKPFPQIVVDGVFFQQYQTGIARVWKSLLEEWADNGFAKHIVLLDRVGTAPKINGIRCRNVPAYDYKNLDADRRILQQICDEEKANLFISTYYTTPLSTPSVFMAYDMIPEVMQWNLSHPMWQEKHYGIQHAAAYIAISENTARDLKNIFPAVAEKSITVAPCGVKSIFSPAAPETVSLFKRKYGISKPYFLLVGAAGSYKNVTLFLQAFAKLQNKHEFEIVCTGASSFSEDAIKTFLSGIALHKLVLDDEELSVAYSGAVAIVYPSKYEGFGLPILEAIACGCPVITCPNASIPEVAGEAAIYVKDDDVNGLVKALSDVQNPEVRQPLVAAGLEQAKKFSWAKMADTVSSTLIQTAKQVCSQIVEQVQQQLQDYPVDSSEFLNRLIGCINLYDIDPSDQSVLTELRIIRKTIADFWLSTATEELKIFYLGNVGKEHQLLIQSGIQDESLIGPEQRFVDELIAYLAKELETPNAINYQLAAMLYLRSNQLPSKDDNCLPQWLLNK